MSTETQTSSQQMHSHAFVKAQALLLPFATSFMIATPAALASYMMMQTRLSWAQSDFFVIAILALMGVDFLTLFLIEPYRSRIGDLTIPALLAFIGMTVSFVMNETFNRFVTDYGFGWLTPLVVVCLAIIYGSVFRERYLPLKLFLCFNGLALTLLWSLGDADKVTLPF